MSTRAVMIVLACSSLLVAAPASSPTAAPVVIAASKPRPRVTLISDSVAGAIAFDTGAKAILAEGVDLFLEPGEARRLGGETPPGGIAPPTVLELIAMLGPRLGPTVIISTGYNDVPSQYAVNLELALTALHGAGVEHVLWTTLHVSAAHTSYARINDAIEAAAAHHPEITVVDWNAYASGHPEWFQPDDVHVEGDGPRAMAREFRASLLKLRIPAGPS
jgi:hypothetical protein